MDKHKKISMLYFYTRDEMLRVDLRRVGYFQADRNYTDVYFLNGYRATLSTNLMAIEQMLDDDRRKGRTIPFVRSGRSLSVNLSCLIHINVPKQEIVLYDMQSPCVLKVTVKKEALKKLKDRYTQK